MAATRASGTTAVRYGTMKDNVLALKVVLPNGELMSTSAARAEVVGRVRSCPVDGRGRGDARRLSPSDPASCKAFPTSHSAASGPFPSTKAACDAAIAAIQSGIPIARVELLDEVQVRACNADAKLDLPERSMLFLEFHGTEAGVREQSERFGEVVAEFAVGPFQWAPQPEGSHAPVGGAAPCLLGANNRSDPARPPS